MRQAEASSAPITMDYMMKAPSPLLVTKISRLFSVLNKKTVGTARNQIKSLQIVDALEGWGLLRLNLCKKDRQRLQKDYDQLMNLSPVKINDFKDFPDLQRRWELELKRFTNIDADYHMGKLQKRNVLCCALPHEIKKEVDSHSARSNSSLEDYDNFIDVVIHLLRSLQFHRHALLSTNIVEEQPIIPDAEIPNYASKAQYTFEEWSQDLQTE